MSYTDNLQPMDIIIIYNPKSILHRIIHRVTEYKAGHVALYVGDGKIYEACSHGIVRKNVKKYTSKHRVFTGRYLQLKEFDEIQIRNYCFRREGQRYSFLQLPMILFQYIFKLKKIPDVSKKAMICSEFIAKAYLSIQIKLSKKLPHETTPADIMNSNKLKVVRWQ